MKPKMRRYPEANSDSAKGAVKITASTTNDIWGVTFDADKVQPCIALCVGTGGTATFIDALGQTCTNYPLQTGYNPISIVQLRSLGTASDVWALTN